MYNNPNQSSNTPWGHYINPEQDFNAPAGAAPPTTGLPATSDIPWGSLAGGAISAFGDILGQTQREDPYAAADPYLSQIPGQMGGYMDPYIQAGKQGIGTLEEQYNKLLQDPTALMTQIGSRFKASPGYQYNVDEATRAANQAASAGGMAGSPAEQQELAGRVTGMASQDYGRFMDRALNLYGTGLSGWGGLERGGQQASQQMSENMARYLESKAKEKYAQTQTGDEQRGGLVGDITGIGAGLAPLLF